MFDKLATRAHDRLRKCAEKEAKKTATTIDHFERVEVDRGNALGTALGAAIRGRVRAKQFQIYRMSNDVRRFLYVEPFDDTVALPGEFHTLAVGALPQPVTFVRGTLKGRWETNGDEVLAARLSADRALHKAVKKLVWSRGHGVRVDFHWGIQVRSVGDGTSHVVMQAGTFGVFNESPGIGVFLAIVAALEPLMGASAGAQGLYYDCQTELFDRWSADVRRAS